MNGLEGKPGENSIWATTCLGDVYSFDPVNFKVHFFMISILIVLNFMHYLCKHLGIR